MGFVIEEGWDRRWREPTRSGYYLDLIEEAAVLWESLSQNHPFIDGNKRLSVTVTGAFLKINGYQLSFDDSEAFEFLTLLNESGHMRFPELETWLRLHTKLINLT